MDPQDLVLRGGRVLDPSAQRPVDLAADVRIQNGRIVEIGRGRGSSTFATSGSCPG
jgi:predicted amidohydrolase